MIIAFCFLLTYSFPMEKIWERFFKNIEYDTEYVIIIHAKNNFILESNFLKNKVHIINPIQTKWGDISLVKAQNLMLEYATKKQNADFCCILSGNCIPIKNFETIRNDLDNFPTSRFFITDSYHSIFKKKQSQWCILSLEHIQMILRHEEKYIDIFKKNNFESIDNIFGAPDEFFYITLILWQGFDNFSKNGCTYCNWSSVIHLGHPKEYKKISKNKINSLKKMHYFFARKFSPQCTIKGCDNLLLINDYDINEKLQHKIDIELKEIELKKKSYNK